MPVRFAHFALTNVTGPSEEPVSIEETRSHLREDSTEQDEIINALITAAREDGEDYTRQAWVTQTWDLKLDDFPDGDEPILVPKPPLQSITYIRYVAATGNTATLTATGYRVDTDSEPGRVEPAVGTTWPTNTRDVTGAVTVRFIAGYGAAAAVPQKLKRGLLLHVGNLYENRESSGGLSEGIKRLWGSGGAYRLG